MTTQAEPDFWCIKANIVQLRRYGPARQEVRHGTRLFRGGARVLVVGSYSGADVVVVIGRHRRSLRFIGSALSVELLENFQLKKIFGLTERRIAQDLAQQESGAYVPLTQRDDVERLMADMLRAQAWWAERRAKLGKLPLSVGQHGLAQTP